MFLSARCENTRAHRHSATAAGPFSFLASLETPLSSTVDTRAHTRNRSTRRFQRYYNSFTNTNVSVKAIMLTLLHHTCFRQV